ncbi:MAG: aminotransferase class I/II-fold pyridoxal phosphate-dependent enzyme [Pseudomonadota bacterium]|nr:aminotransferase class I/II-fold pyridoxal phosphate-dependent enzyme [Pseudomonadota bacterium]
MTAGESGHALVGQSKEQLQALEQAWSAELDAISGANQQLDLSRGKPGVEQLALSDGLETMIAGDYISIDGTDTRNYGGLMGIAEARALGAQIMDVPADEIMAAGNSSLNLMHLVLHTATDLGLWGDERKWRNSNKIKVLTPVPGYDRHFVLCEHFGMEMINIPMLATGPDMQRAAEVAAADANIKAIWCVPKYANPTGCTYSADTVKSMAELPKLAAAEDFVVLWDNAYAVHHFEQPGDSLASIRDAAATAATSEHIVQFASTSKITFAGGGVGFVSAASNVLQSLSAHLSVQTVGPDKVNQLRHARFLSGRIAEHMEQHATILRPKFALVDRMLSEQLGALDIASWTQPNGGYFISLDVLPGLAQKVVAMAKTAGLVLTPAGATFPYGIDPEDRNVRIAPTFGSLSELQGAMQILTLCVKLASARHLLAQG